MAKPKMHPIKKENGLYWYKTKEGPKKYAYRYKYYDKNGERKEIPKQGFTSEKAALQALMAVKAKIISGNLTQVENENLTIAQWCNMYLESKRSDWKPTTYKNSKNAIELHINPSIGKHKLATFDKITYKREFIDTKLEKYKASTVKTWNKTFIAAINCAVDNEIIPRNRFNNIAFKDEQTDENVITAKQLRSVLDYFDGRTQLQHVAIHLLAFTGIRIGEMCGLTWGDIDLDEETISINKTRDFYGVRSPKTRNSYRIFKIDEKLLKLLKGYRGHVAHAHLRLGKKITDKTFVLINDQTTNPVDVTSIQKALRVASEKLGFKVKPHTLRHTYATLLIANGVDVVTVAARLGDTSEMVFKVYAHAVEENKNKTIEVFKRAIEQEGF